jgi:hypothetical protein
VRKATSRATTTSHAVTVGASHFTAWDEMKVQSVEARECLQCIIMQMQLQMNPWRDSRLTVKVPDPPGKLQFPTLRFEEQTTLYACGQTSPLSTWKAVSTSNGSTHADTYL